MEESRAIAAIKDRRQKLEARIKTLHETQLDLLASLQPLVPEIVSSVDLSLKIVSSFNNRPFTPTPSLLHRNPITRPRTAASADEPPNTQNPKPSLGSNPVRSYGGASGMRLGGGSVPRPMPGSTMGPSDAPGELGFMGRGIGVIHRPTAKEATVAAKFKTKGGSQLKEYCTSLTKEDCRRQTGSYIACDKVHFRRIIAPHTDVDLGDCPYHDCCYYRMICKHVHYELDPTPDVLPMMRACPPPKQLKPQGADYCSEVELGEPQWINCDIRDFKMEILGQFGVIMADPPWHILMGLPFGTMTDDEIRSLNVPPLQTNGLMFLWVTARAMELGRECLELWGYMCVEEMFWVKTNQLQRISISGRNGQWLNHSKEHCLVGLKGNPEVNRNIDTDVIVAEIRESSRKPDEMYPMLERISPGTRKLELFARMHNTHAGWISLGNQLNGVRLVDEGLRARFKAAYPDVEVHPPSPPRYSAMEEVD